MFYLFVMVDIIETFGRGISRYGYQELFQDILKMISNCLDYFIVFNCSSVMGTNLVILDCNQCVSLRGGLSKPFNMVEYRSHFLVLLVFF